MLNNSHYIDNRNGAKELDSNIKGYLEILPALKDAKATVKTLETKIEPFKKAIIKAGELGLNETNNFVFELTQKASYEKVKPLKDIKENYPDIYKLLKDNDLIENTNSNVLLGDVQPK